MALAGRHRRGFPLASPGSPNWAELSATRIITSRERFLRPEADAIIRHQTQGARSLDDFCKRFLGPSSSHDDVVPYDLPEIVKHLKATADYDWEPFLLHRVSQPSNRFLSTSSAVLATGFSMRPTRPHPAVAAAAVTPSRPGIPSV